MSGSNPVAELREAARLMRERVALVPPSPWFSAMHDVTTNDGLNVIASSGLTVRAQYIASWHPAVALAVADWLEATAISYEEIAASPYVAAGAAFVAGFEHGELDPAIAVARAYLGDDVESAVRAQLGEK